MSDLVIGASGLVGRHLVEAGTAAGISVIGTYHSHPYPRLHQLDICDCPSVRSLVMQLRPNVVYLPAALANVDYCEQHPAAGYARNVIGVNNVVNAVNEVQAKLVYFSSDYVFDGKAGPYSEKDSANPICEYGRQKLIAEHYVALNAHNYLIVRTTIVYGSEPQGKNFIYRLTNTLKAGQVLRVPVDQVGSPTYAPNLAQAVVELVHSNTKGLYHVAGSQRVNRYQFACEAASAFGLDSSLIQAVATSELRQSAPRPLNAGMVVEKAVSQLSIPLMDYWSGLKKMASDGGLK